MVKFCPACRRTHGCDCPAKVRNKFMRELRKGRTNKRKLYADSTMRRANQLALSTDVAVMSGGGIGQICNSLPLDPRRRQHEEVIIQGGANDLMTDSLHEFVYTVAKTEEKLRKLAESNLVTLVLPPVPTDVPEMEAKARFLIDKLTRIETIQHVLLESVEMDDTNHPSIDGTREIIEQINAVMDNEIILDDCGDHVTFPVVYRHVQPVFKVGCRGCDSLLVHTSYLCGPCREKATKTNVRELEVAMHNLIGKAFFPAVETDGKRAQTTDDDDDDDSDHYE